MNKLGLAGTGIPMNNINRLGNAYHEQHFIHEETKILKK